MMNRQTAKRPVLAALALVLCLSAAIGGAMAYFTDYEDAHGGAVIRLGGQTEIDEGSDTRNKHVVITNTGETNVIVRAAVLYSEQDGVTIGVTNEDGWTKGSDGFYYYGKVLTPEEGANATSGIDVKVSTEWKADPGKKTSEDHPNLDDYEITVVHESAQAIYDIESQKLAAPEGWDASAVSAIIPLSHPQSEEGMS